MRGLIVALVLILVTGACSTDGSGDDASAAIPTIATPPTTADEDLDTEGDVETTSTDSSGVVLAVSPDLIAAAVEAGDLSQQDADLLTGLALAGGASAIPDHYLVPAAEVSGRSRWDHGALTRLIERWDSIDPPSQSVLLNGIPGLDNFVESPIKSLLSSPGYDGCQLLFGNVRLCRGTDVSGDTSDIVPFAEAADVINDRVVEAVTKAYPEFESLFGASNPPVDIVLDNLEGFSDGTYMYGVAFLNSQSKCIILVDVMLANAGSYSVNSSVGVSGVPDGTPTDTSALATTVHELFHCFQHFSGVPANNWLREGSAVWSEHHIYGNPDLNSELAFMGDFVVDPDRPFLERSYDASFPFMYRDLVGGSGGPQAIISTLLSANLPNIHSDFETFWHNVSVSAWNQDPVTVLLDNGAQVAGVVADWGVMPINENAEETMEFSIPAYSRDIQTFEFMGGTAEADLVEFARLRLDLSSVPADVKISALAETTNGWEEPELLTGAERVLCRIAVGPCNDVPEAQIKPYSRIVLIATNTSSANQAFSLPWNTFNPHLHGKWRRIEGPVSLIAGNAAPYWILNTTLSFDEPEFTMAEATGAYNKVDFEAGWVCGFGGAYTIGGDPTYGSPAFGNVAGSVGITGPGSGSTFTNDCVYTSQGSGPGSGKETEVSGLHIPVNAAGGPGPFGFEIFDHDTVVITGFAVQYVYTRVSHTP